MKTAAAGSEVYQPVDSPVATASRRVDHVSLGGVPNGRRAVCGSRVVLDQPRRHADGRTLWPSDHYSVLADLGVFGIQCAP